MENTLGKWHPLCFQPARQPAPWGGSLLAELRPADAGAPGGVSWEILDAPGCSSVVANGPHAGRTLAELTAELKSDLIGRRWQPGKPFPLYIRLLDVGRHLPLQVHPDEMLARQNPAQGNTKFWYCLSAREPGEIMVGIGARVTRQQLVGRLAAADMRELLQAFPACPGDSYLVPAGRVHTASPDVLLWEVGHHPCEPMEITAENADPATLPMRAVHFEDRQVSRVCRETAPVVTTRRIPLVHHCPYFVVDEIRLTDDLADRTDGASFHLFTVIRGRMQLACEGGSVELATGATCLIPAALGNYRCIAAGGPAAALRVRMQNLK